MKNYKVTLENDAGKCKRVIVSAFNEYDAMALAQKGAWYAVEAVLLGS
jgi:hypothetical protein